jgi:hypothetical protein
MVRFQRRTGRHLLGPSSSAFDPIRKCDAKSGTNQIRAFMLECGIAVRQGLRFRRAETKEPAKSILPIVCHTVGVALIA